MMTAEDFDRGLGTKRFIMQPGQLPVRRVGLHYALTSVLFATSQCGPVDISTGLPLHFSLNVYKQVVARNPSLGAGERGQPYNFPSPPPCPPPSPAQE
ncbi:unnamed protein product, partial [Iphiclides podalirius]